MNDTNIKHRFLVLALIMFSAFAANALTLNPLIENQEGQQLVNQKPLLFKDQLIYFTKQEDDYTMRSFDVVDNSYTILHTFDQYFYPNFYVLENYFYFKDHGDQNKIWRSNGEESGTHPVDMSSLVATTLYSGATAQKGGLIFTLGSTNGNHLIVLNNDEITVYKDLYKPSPNAACGFGVYDVVIPSRVSGTSQDLLIRHKNNNIIDYSDDLPENFEIDQNRVWFYENTCFYQIDGYPTSDILVIPEQGAHFFLGEELGFSRVNFLTRFKGSYYILAEDGDRYGYVVKLSDDLSTIDKQVEFNYVYDNAALIVSEQYLIATTRTGGGVSPPAGRTSYYDAALNKNDNLGGFLVPAPEVYLKSDGEVIVFNDFKSGLAQKIIGTDITNSSSGFVFNGNAIKHVIVKENSPESFVLRQKLDTGDYQIDSLDIVPNMGSLSVGNWFDPDYQSQGMSIVEGHRDDGSRYLFVTLYLFRDGQPLWLAGTSNINYPQSTLDIELGEYSGLVLWQADTPAHVEKFADMTLSMSSCHQMMMHLETLDGQTFNIGLQRMVNNDINQYCKD